MENILHPVESTQSKSFGVKLRQRRIQIRNPIQMYAATTEHTPQLILFNPGKQKDCTSVVSAAYPGSQDAFIPCTLFDICHKVM